MLLDNKRRAVSQKGDSSSFFKSTWEWKKKNERETMKIAIMGYGTIGSGVAKVLEDNHEIVKKNTGESLDIKYILDLRNFPEDPNNDKIVNNVDVIVNDPEIKIVVETMGGLHPAFEFVKKCLEAGKSVTTSNKALVADYGVELQKIARKNKAGFMCEASVGGGIPILRVLNTCLTADIIEEISGIVNGTTNYMLTEMDRNGTDFDEVLKDAQNKGYAEKDPTADIEGYDAARKIAILTSIVSHHNVDFNDIPVEGITKISVRDMAYAKRLNMAIKLIANATKIDNSYSIRVAPYLVGNDNPLFSVNGAFNAIFVKGNMLGDSMYYGSGAGSLPTASAVCADIIALAKKIDEPEYEFYWDDEKLEILDPDETESKFFVRTRSSREETENIFPDAEFLDELYGDEVSFITKKNKEKEILRRLEKLSGVIQKIRIKD
jgi:homoserine dehydrogenase